MPKIILIVEDYDDSRMFMKFLLESFGYQVCEAIDGEKAVEYVKRHNPDLILMDISMPHMDGLEATRTIRNLEHGTEIPIIALTGCGKSYYQKAIEAGCDKVLAKPLDFDYFEPMLKEYLV